MKIKRILKNQSILLILIFILLSALTISDQAQVLKIRVIKDKAAIREKADINSPVIAKVPIGAVLESEKKEGEWYKVSFLYRGRFTISGYIHQDNIEIFPEIKKEKPVEVLPKPKIEKEEISIPEEKIEEKPKKIPREIKVKHERTPEDERFFASKNKIMNSFEEKKEILLKEKENIQQKIEKDNRKIKSLNTSITRLSPLIFKTHYNLNIFNELQQV